MTFSTLASPGVSLQGGGGSGGGAASLPISGNGATVTASTPLVDGTQTWNNAAVTFTGLKFNAAGTSDANSAAASLLMDLQVNTASRFKVQKNGYVFSTFASVSTGAGEINLNYYQSGVGVSSAGQFTFSSSGSTASGSDTILTRRAAANLRLGAADTTGTTAPTPQFLSAQSWASSTTNNQTGANFTIDGSQGTGTGAGGSIIFRVAPAGSTSNGVQNALATALTIASNKDVTFGNDMSVSGNVGLGGAIWSGNSSTTGYANAGVGLINSSGGLILGSSKYIAWVNAANLIGTQDLILARDAANTLALRNGANAQEFRVYENTTGTIYKAILGNRQLIKIAGAAFNDGAGASAGTITNAPAAGNPTKWIPIDDNGTTRHIPAW